MIRIAAVALRAALALGAISVLDANLAGTGLAQATPPEIVGDAIPLPLAGQTGDALRGDAARGRAIVVDRQVGLCLLCHSGPFPEQRLQGTLAPELAGAGRRWSEGQLRLRIVDAAKTNPATIMPPYYRTEGLVRVAGPYRGKTLLTAQQIEDVVAFLMTLRD